jgi:glyoxylase-like metal-dependent hydrolase (beta-lactamase superfamily II)
MLPTLIHIEPKNMKSPISDIIHPIKIPTPFPVGDVFSYLIKTEKIILIDTGHFHQDAYLCMDQALYKYGVEISDIDEIWITHGHPDHFGLANRLRDESGAVVMAPYLDRVNFEGNKDGPLFKVLFQSLQIPDDIISKMGNELQWLRQYQQPLEPDNWLAESDFLNAGGYSFKVKHLPGHSPGHLVFIHEDITFGGDVLLSHISTNALISFDPETGKRNRSFLQYRNSLEWITDHGNLFYPGHGHFINDSRTLARKYLHEQTLRMENIKNLIDEKPVSITELAMQLFPVAWKQEAYFLVLSEVLGFLDWGVELDLFCKIETGTDVLFKRS